MSDAESATLDHLSAHDAHDDHAAGHGHEEPGEPLGAVDLAAWGAALLGGAIGLLTAVALFTAGG